MYLNNGMFQIGRLTKGVKILIYSCIAVFFIKALLPFRLEQLFDGLFALNVDGILHGWLWQFITYAFLHGNLFHLLMNMLGLYFLGPELERHLGTKAFMTLMVFCAILGGVGWLSLTYPQPGSCVGASGAIVSQPADYTAHFLCSSDYHASLAYGGPVRSVATRLSYQSWSLRHRLRCSSCRRHRGLSFCKGNVQGL